MSNAKTKTPKLVRYADEAESEMPDAGRAESAIANCEAGMMPIVADWLQNKLFRKNQQWLSVAGDHTVLLTPAPQGHKRITLNLFNDKVRTLVSKLTAQQPIPVVTPATSSSDDRAIARECEHLLQWVWRDKECARELDYAAYDGLDCGGFWWHVYWDPQSGREVETVNVLDLETGQPKIVKQQSGDVVVHFVSNFDMRVDPSAMRLEEAQWVARVSYMSTEKVELRWNVEVAPDAAGSRPNIMNTDWIMNPQRMLAQDMCKIVEFWQRKSDEYPSGFYGVICNGGFIYFEDELKGNEFPFVYAELDPDPDNFYGNTPMSLARRAQVEFNAVMSQLSDGRSRGMFGSWLAARGSGMDIPTGAPHEVLGYNDTAREPKFVQPQPVSEQAFKIASTFGDLVSVTSGVTDADNATSGKDRLYAAEQDNTKLGPALRSLHMFLKRVGMRVLNLYRDNATFDVLYALSDKNAQSDVRTFSAQTIRYSSIEMSIDSALPLNRQAKREQVIALYQAGLIDKSKALKALDFGEVEDMLGSSNLDRERARNENTMLLIQMVGVQDFDDHAAHLEEHLAEMKQEKWYLLDPAVQANYTNHANLHRQFIQMQLGMGGGAPQNPLTSGGGAPKNGVGAMADVPATRNAPNSTLPIEAHVTPRDNAALGEINGSTNEG